MQQEVSLAALDQPEAMTGAETAPTALVLYHNSPSAVKFRRDGLCFSGRHHAHRSTIWLGFERGLGNQCVVLHIKLCNERPICRHEDYPLVNQYSQTRNLI